MIDLSIDEFVVHVSRRFKSLFEVSYESVYLEFRNIPPEVADGVDFKYLLVRYGNNELLNQGPSSIDKRRMRLRNNVIEAEQYYVDDERELTVEFPIKLHDVLSTEFKPFVDADDIGLIEPISNRIENHPDCQLRTHPRRGPIEEPNSSGIERLYFIFRDMPVTETPEGFKNNVLYTIPGESESIT